MSLLCLLKTDMTASAIDSTLVLMAAKNVAYITSSIPSNSLSEEAKDCIKSLESELFIVSSDILPKFI